MAQQIDILTLERARGRACLELNKAGFMVHELSIGKLSFKDCTLTVDGFVQYKKTGVREFLKIIIQNDGTTVIENELEEKLSVPEYIARFQKNN